MATILLTGTVNGTDTVNVHRCAIGYNVFWYSGAAIDPLLGQVRKPDENGWQWSRNASLGWDSTRFKTRTDAIRELLNSWSREGLPGRLA